MNPKLVITVELAWRGGTLDIVSNVAEFDLYENEKIKGLYGLSSSESKPVKLANGELIYVWAALTPSNRYVFHIEHNKKIIINLETENEFYMEAYMPDNKLYQFAIRNRT
jgi:hypothetical protein